MNDTRQWVIDDYQSVKFELYSYADDCVVNASVVITPTYDSDLDFIGVSVRVTRTVKPFKVDDDPLLSAMTQLEIVKLEEPGKTEHVRILPMYNNVSWNVDLTKICEMSGGCSYKGAKILVELHKAYSGDTNLVGRYGGKGIIPDIRQRDEEEEKEND